MALIEVKNIKKYFGKVHALNGPSFFLESGGQYVIQGASGSGKSTLLYLMAGLDRPSSGEILIEGKNLATFDDEQLAYYRNNDVGLVFQFHFLLPSMNCMDNILLPAQIKGISGRKRQELEADIKQLAVQLGVDHCLKKYPYELSGGEQQRVNILRALSLRPKLLLCDEPTGNLDSENSEKVTQLLQKLAKESHATLVIVTHDNNVAQHFSQKLFMRDGVLVDSAQR